MESISYESARPTARLPADAARRRVLDQHVGLRKLLSAGLEHANAMVAGALSSGIPLRLLIVVIQDQFVRHLADEEALIVPILEDDLPIGPRRIALLKEEHEAQRADLAKLHAWPERDDQYPLALAFRDLARELLADIEREEQELLIPDVIRDDGIVIDQCGG